MGNHTTSAACRLLASVFLAMLDSRVATRSSRPAFCSADADPIRRRVAILNRSLNFLQSIDRSGSQRGGDYARPPNRALPPIGKNQCDPLSSISPHSVPDHGTLHAAKRFLDRQLAGHRYHAGNAPRDRLDLADLGSVRNRAIQCHHAVFRDDTDISGVDFPVIVSDART